MSTKSSGKENMCQVRLDWMFMPSRYNGVNRCLYSSQETFFFNYIYLFLAVLGHHCCMWDFSSCGEWGLLFVAVHGLLLAVAAFVAEHGLQTCGLSSCGTRAQLLHGMWNLPGPGIEPVSPALADGLSTTGPPGNSSLS